MFVFCGCFSQVLHVWYVDEPLCHAKYEENLLRVHRLCQGSSRIALTCLRSFRCSALAQIPWRFVIFVTWPGFHWNKLLVKCPKMGVPPTHPCFFPYVPFFGYPPILGNLLLSNSRDVNPKIKA